ncbi:hypothetical protein BTO06_07165 [Tenacibaculum sp. SZ-18]|uniref:hypothetical protein n=1 Tax=Tenacibaculum TaxID=104267 RepID=UPI000C2D1772|nr:hypothetical protein [Tenacibaculum sp. SZ-18]AUC14930.1 hypothetical protein BTO06_07165 [Tenacibaculum sp. SZ-18]
MKSNLSKFKKYQINNPELLKSIGGELTPYQECMFLAMIGDDDFDKNQNKWQDICAKQYGSPTASISN